LNLKGKRRILEIYSWKPQHYSKHHKYTQASFRLLCKVRKCWAARQNIAYLPARMLDINKKIILLTGAGPFLQSNFQTVISSPSLGCWSFHTWCTNRIQVLLSSCASIWTTSSCLVLEGKEWLLILYGWHSNLKTKGTKFTWEGLFLLYCKVPQLHLSSFSHLWYKHYSSSAWSLQHKWEECSTNLGL